MAARPPTLLSPDQILAHAERHCFDLATIDFHTPIDRARFYICPTLTPLYYTDVYHQLSADDTRRYNQLSALCFGEMISFFESAFVRTLHALAVSRQLQPTLKACVRNFIADEDKHREMWRRLNRLSEPTWYARTEHRIVRIPWPTRAVLAWLVSHPERFPVVVWMMLTLEEHSMEISRRCNRMPADAIEPRYRAVYRLHMEEEIRHVHTDQNLLRHLLDGLTARQLRTTRWLFRRAVDTFLLRPRRAAVRVVDALIAERSGLRPLRNAMVRQLSVLHTVPAYTRLMFSPETTPAAWAFWADDRFPDMSEAPLHC